MFCIYEVAEFVVILLTAYCPVFRLVIPQSLKSVYLALFRSVLTRPVMKSVYLALFRSVLTRPVTPVMNKHKPRDQINIFICVLQSKKITYCFFFVSQK